MTKKGALDKFIRSTNEELMFAEEQALAQTALAVADALSKANITQQELAARLGVSEAQISQILKAVVRNPTVKTIARIGCALKSRMVIQFVALP